MYTFRANDDHLTSKICEQNLDIVYAGMWYTNRSFWGLFRSNLSALKFA